MTMALIFGSTGLVGSHLLENLNRDAFFTHITCLGRSAPKHMSTKTHFIAWTQASSLVLPNHPSHAFCCLGTTMKNAGSRDAFYQIDFELCLKAAQLSKQLGCRQFHFVSSHGADPYAWNFYLKTKGQIEQALIQLNFESLHIYRPSILLGHRQKKRFGEQLMIDLAPYYAPLLIGPLANIRPVKASSLALFIAQNAKTSASGLFFHSSFQINQSQSK